MKINDCSDKLLGVCSLIKNQLANIGFWEYEANKYLRYLIYQLMNYIELFGFLGTFLSCITFIPQVYKTWQTKRVEDLSLTMLMIVFTSTLVWLVYAFALMLWPVIIANIIIGVLSAMLIYFKFAYKK